MAEYDAILPPWARMFDDDDPYREIVVETIFDGVRRVARTAAERSDTTVHLDVDENRQVVLAVKSPPNAIATVFPPPLGCPPWCRVAVQGDPTIYLLQLRLAAPFFWRFAEELRAQAMDRRGWCFAVNSYAIGESLHARWCAGVADATGRVALFVNGIVAYATLYGALCPTGTALGRHPSLDHFPRFNQVAKLAPTARPIHAVAWLRQRHREVWGDARSERDQILLAWPGNDAICTARGLLRAPTDVLLAAQALREIGADAQAHAVLLPYRSMRSRIDPWDGLTVILDWWPPKMLRDDGKLDAPLPTFHGFDMRVDPFAG